MRLRASLGICAALLPSLAASALDRPANPGNYRALLLTLSPGDRMILAPGVYPSGLPITNRVGTAALPIEITGPETGPPAIIYGRSCCNTISIVDSAYVAIRHLEVDMRGEAVDGLKAEASATFAHHITVEHVQMYGFGGDQQVVGINTKCPTWDWIIRFVTIEDGGTGMYLGDSNGDEPFVRGLIENNLIVNPIGYAMQIKQQNPRPNLVGMPTGDNVTIVRDNVLIKAARASTGGLARPSLLVGHWPLSGVGQNDRYEIYGNFLYENASMIEGLFQGEGNLAFHDNVLVNTFGVGVISVPHYDLPRNVSVYNNTIYSVGRAIQISGGAVGTVQRVVGNAVFSNAVPAITGGVQADNFTASTANASMYVASPGTPLGQLDLYPIAGSALEGSPLDLSFFAAHLDHDLDFDGTVKSRLFRGAYSGSGSNPGWTLAQEIKTRGGAVGGDGGVIDDGGEDDGGALDGGVAGVDAAAPDAAAPDAAAPDAAPRDAALRDAALRDAAPPDAAPPDAAPPDAAPPDAAPRDAAPRDAAPRDAAPRDASARDAAARDAAADDAAADDAAADDATADDASPDDALPDDASPDDALPDDALPDDALRDDALPEDASSGAGASADASVAAPPADAGEIILSASGCGCTSSPESPSASLASIFAVVGLTRRLTRRRR